MARAGEVVVLTEKGKPAFAIVGLKDDLALEALALSRSSRFMAYLDRIGRGSKKERTYSLAEMREEFIPDRSRARKRGRPRGGSGK
jgi:antitoxin (DNA-binding transcriptional repressor) of toxin-antitoxin stability system